ncbi:MAG: peptidylprolyl isomerase [Planctomycetota bacterium]|nr:peptidylprolyl isomerase [Planctomycetota bacterium]MDA1262195.1 peptidylprolyl isomerase [Planctomycetota bacterium]
MKSNRRLQIIALNVSTLCLYAVVLCGCSTEPRGLDVLPADSKISPRENLETRPSAKPISTNDRPPAIFNGDVIGWDEMQPRLYEVSGGQVIEEIVLERLLRQELRLANITVDEAAIALEEKTALEALAKDPVRAAQLLTALRNAQSLGPARWAALLWRNAALRALAKREITITDDEIRQAYDTAHGPRRIGRLIVVSDIAAAEKVRTRLNAGEPFSEVAAQLSIDSSAERGGLLAPITRLDPSFPPAFREVLFTIKPGENSAAILLENGYAIVQLREEIPGDGANPATTRAEDERSARRAQERVEMDRLARTLLRKARPTIFDDSLSDSWNRRPRTEN